MAATDTLRAEYEALTEGCGLVDRSEHGKLALTGSGAVEFLNGQVTNELTDLRPGEGRYAAFLTNKGKMLGDLRILAVGADPDGPPSELLLDTERVALQALFDTIRRYKIGYEVDLHKRTVECGLLSLVGPRRGQCVTSAGPTPYIDAIEHAHAPAQIGGAPVRLIATADGMDVLCETPIWRRGARGPDRRRRAIPPARRRQRSCASSAGRPATGWTSTRARSPRRPASTSAQ